MSSPVPTPASPLCSQDLTLYDSLLSILASHSRTALEIDTLPSSYPPILQHSHDSLGIPKQLLIQCFLTARTILISYLQSREHAQVIGRPPTHDDALQATLIILLYEPNHITAVNFRKKHLSSLQAAYEREDLSALSTPKTAAETFKDAIFKELKLISNLVTSPLFRHAKSSTLWAHRFWILQTSPRDVLAGDENAVDTILTEELGTVMQAGERHPKNYYSWNYARQIVRLLGPDPQSNSEISLSLSWERNDTQIVLLKQMKIVHHWCLAHPRDISGWAFLVFVVNQIRTSAIKSAASRGSDEIAVDPGIKLIIEETKDFVRRFDWRGESIYWFLWEISRYQVTRDE